MNNLTFSVMRIRDKLSRLKARKQNIKAELFTIEDDFVRYTKQLEMYQDVCSHEFKLHTPAFTKSNLDNIRFDLHTCSICGAETVVEEDISDLQEVLDDN